jgi:RNA polymerase sigma-70 factor (ECF subfamily)
VERHQGRAFRLALRVLRSEEAAKDAVQEAFVKAWTSLPRFREEARFSTWLHRLVVNQSIDMLRREHPERRVETEDGDPSALAEARAPRPAASAPAAPAAELLRAELGRQIGTALEALPDTLRQTLLLREVDGLSYAEIARVQGIPRGTVMSRLHYARRQARALLQEAGVAPEGALLESGVAPEGPSNGESGAGGAEASDER